MNNDDRPVPIDGLLGNVTLNERADRISARVSARIRRTRQVSASTGLEGVIEVLANPWITGAAAAACAWLLLTGNKNTMLPDEPANVTLGVAIGIPSAITTSQGMLPAWLRAEGGE